MEERCIIAEIYWQILMQDYPVGVSFKFKFKVTSYYLNDKLEFINGFLMDFFLLQ